MHCNCENLHCQVCQGQGCTAEAGQQKFLYIGVVCDPCAAHMDPKYKVENAPTCPPGCDHKWNTQCVLSCYGDDE